MRTVAIITEYNPFHNGHHYQIHRVREELNCDHVIVVMSGEFTQRGIPALFPKGLRTEIALQMGVDAVFALPAVFSTGSGEIFARGALELLAGLGVVDTLVYGTEGSCTTARLRDVASLLSSETPEFTKELQAALSSGLSYPAAMEQALRGSFNGDSCEKQETPELSELFLPNNVLALEYEKQLIRMGNPMSSQGIPRKGNGYGDESLQGSYVSASALRNLLEGGVRSFHELEPYVPSRILPLMERELGTAGALFANDFSQQLYYALWQKKPAQLAQYADCNETLANKICNHLEQFQSVTDFISRLKTRDFTYNRISRALCHVMLGITGELQQFALNEPTCRHARLLGFDASAEPLLRSIKANASIPLITGYAQAKKTLHKNAMTLLDHDVSASNLYYGAVRTKYGCPQPGEERRPLRKTRRIP